MPYEENGRVVETKTEARAGDSHREPLNALLWGTGGVVVLFFIIYVIFFGRGGV